MDFDLEQAMEVLTRTPQTLRALLSGLPPGWTSNDEGPDTWSPYDVLGHLIHGEKTDWIARMRRILDHGESRAFEPFDRFAQFRESAGKTLEDLLDQFARLRADNLETLRGLELTAERLERKGRHPELGTVTLGQLLATWTVHDLGHIAQIARVMAKQYAGQVGPWQAYLPVLAPRPSTD
jgi:hypothetical protein